MKTNCTEHKNYILEEKIGKLSELPDPLGVGIHQRIACEVIITMEVVPLILFC